MAIARVEEAEEKERVMRMEDATASLKLKQMLDANIAALDPPESLSSDQIRFLVAYSTLGVLSETCRITSISYHSHKRWLQDVDYRIAFETSQKMYSDDLEFMAFKLATGQVLRPVVNQGKIVTYERIFDTRLLAKIVSAMKPERYTARVDVTTNGHSLMKIVDKAAWDSI